MLTEVNKPFNLSTNPVILVKIGPLASEKQVLESRQKNIKSKDQSIINQSSFIIGMTKCRPTRKKHSQNIGLYIALSASLPSRLKIRRKEPTVIKFSSSGVIDHRCLSQNW